MDRKLMKATFAGGCFWCMQPPFQQIEGVTEVVAGDAGGTKENPSYEEVSSGITGHLESVQVTYDPDKVPYEKLLDVFWTQIDPTDGEGQFADKGSQYRTAIFYHDDEQKRIAEASKKKINDSGKFKKPVATEIRPYTNFYPAEDYHQDYAKKKPREYQAYKTYSGREAFIEKIWGGEKPGEGRKVTIYSTPRCHNCHEIKEFLSSRDVPFEEIDLASNDEARTMIIEKTGHLSAPIVRIGNEFIFGYDRKKMENLLKPGGSPYNEGG
ncbi:MAG: peptide-methionine (S)-S-oxide reductase MsrA [Methanoregula sp.]|uniref:peptide-methionine (S)-S-oxide reductase MsrA n=1 Tax=Methanoregula sp. TaxID=2052170 RepID=UPI003D0B4015